MRKFIVPMLALGMLAACDSSGGSSSRTPAPAKPSGVTLKVMAMKEPERNVVFIRALMDSNLPCDGVTKSERIPDMQGMPYWKAYCTNGSSHLITVTSDGTARIMSHA